MALFGLGPVTVALFVGFGLLIGILFGTLGVGGSFLVTPALLIAGHPATVAVGSGLAFVFGTSLIAVLRHRDRGQIDYRLAGWMIPGMALGIEIGKRVVFLLAALGVANAVISTVYIGLLGAVGLVVLWDARTGGRRASPSHGAAMGQALALGPTVSLPGGATASVWSLVAVSLGIGVLAGVLGVGGGFLLLPAMIYGFGVPAGVAVGTSTLQIVVASAVGTYLYGLANAVDLPVVAALLAGSAFGARIGAGATHLVDDAEITGYFGVMLLAAAVALASKQVGNAYGIAMLDTASVALIVGSALLVSGAIVRAAVESLGADGEQAHR